MKLNLINQSSVPMPRQFIKNWLATVIREFKRQKVLNQKALENELTIIFLNTKEAKKINFQYRGKDYATDVLSFEASDIDEGSLGELVICPQVLKRQAHEHDLSFRFELGYMIAHGVLHLLGYDHERSQEHEKIMFKIQDQVFETTLEKFAKKRIDRQR